MLPIVNRLDYNRTMGVSQRTKGLNGEREFVRTLGALGIEAERNLDQTRAGGADITASLLAESGTVLEVKRSESRRIGPWFDQARAACTNGEEPAVAWRPNRGTWKVYLELDPPEFRDFLLWKAARKSAS